MRSPTVNRAVFLDRDGVLMEDANYVGQVDRVILIPGVISALQRLRTAGFRLFVVTNQSGVARGYFSQEAVELIHNHLDRQFQQHGVWIDHYYVCPHHPEDNCDCRKPKPKFLRDAAETYRLELPLCYMVGDRASDIAAGENAGAKTVLVLTGAGQATLSQGESEPDHVASTLTACADWVLSQ